MLLTPAQIKPKSFESRRNSFFLFFFLFLPGVDVLHVYVRAWALGCFHSLISTRTFRRALTASVDSCAEIKSVPSVTWLNLAEFGGRCRKAVLGVWNGHCLCDSVQAARQLTWTAIAQCTSRCAGQWRRDTALTLPLFWRRSTAFFWRYSLLRPPVPVPNKPPRFCGRKAKWSSGRWWPGPYKPYDVCVYLLAGGSHLDLVFHRPGSMTVFRPQVQENRLVASKLNCHLFSCCYALMFDNMYVLISRMLTATCSGCFVYSVMLLLKLQALVYDIHPSTKAVSV